MELTNLIPGYQPLPFPLPTWLMQLLLLLGFYLHALPMNVVLGGGFVASALFFFGRSDKTSYSYRAAKALAVSLPLFISFAVTQGIVPLLFLQLVYGPAFYTSSILMAAPWLGVLAILLASYYISYIVIYRTLKGEYSTKKASVAALLLLVMSIGFAAIGYIFTNNMTLMLHPEKWLPLYQQAATGMHMNSAEPQLAPRYLHTFLASLAVTGMTLGCFGLYMVKRDEKFSDWMIKSGSRLFLASTLLQIPAGLWYLKSLPPHLAAYFLGGDNLITTIFAASMLLTLLAILFSVIAALIGSKPAFIAALTTNAILILTMIINRHQLRMLYLNPYVKPDSVAVSTQWDLLAIFLVSAVALIAYLVWLSKLMLRAFKKPITNDDSTTTSLTSTTAEIAPST
ncbi:MAG: hypothetical protein JST89_25210 [Cyanobacteria bacterium SZAS-4]|nr:hypothetical protein [Cyanobacteria bacterium SZAS-4]